MTEVSRLLQWSKCGCGFLACNDVSLKAVIKASREVTASISTVEDGGDMFLQNNGTIYKNT
jgi:hypothetical protein